MPAAHPYSVGIGCCLFDRLEEVVVDQAENSVVVIKSDGDAVGASRRGAHPGLRFFVFKGRCPASGILWRVTLSGRRGLRMLDKERPVVWCIGMG